MIKFSIIIPVRAINDYVKESLENIKKLDYKNFEVFIITDGRDSYDPGWDKVKVLVSGNVGPGLKRNLGAKKATGDVLAFLDDDSYPRADWLTNAAKIFEDSKIYALGGPAVTPDNAGYLERMSGWLYSSVVMSSRINYRYIPSEKMLVDDYPSVNLFVRKKAFEEVSGFVTEFWPGEDTKLCLDLVKKYGRKFPYDPEVLVYHHRREIFKPHLKQISRYGQYRGQFARVFPQTSRIPIYFMPSLFFLGLTFGIFLIFLFPILTPIYILSLIIYAVGVSSAASRVAKIEKDHPEAFFDFFKGAFLTHIFYGANFLIGIMKKPRLELKKFDNKTGNYVEG